MRNATLIISSRKKTLQSHFIAQHNLMDLQLGAIFGVVDRSTVLECNVPGCKIKTKFPPRDFAAYRLHLRETHKFSKEEAIAKVPVGTNKRTIPEDSVLHKFRVA